MLLKLLFMNETILSRWSASIYAFPGQHKQETCLMVLFGTSAVAVADVMNMLEKSSLANVFSLALGN